MIPAMAISDPEQERQRLEQSYARMNDDELENAAAHAYELTETANQALRAELTKRGLYEGQMEAEPEDDEVGLRDMVAIRQIRDLPEALFAKGSLESAGIECSLVDDNMVRLDWFISNLLGGVKLMVNAEDAEAANEILNQPIPEGFDAAGTGEYRQPRCPKCQSLDVAFQELNKPVAYVTAWAGLPLPMSHRAWRCQACQAEWADDAAPEMGNSASAS
jgi:wobble nucleotide-excising tRNase